MRHKTKIGISLGNFIESLIAKRNLCSVEKFPLCDSPLTIKGIGQDLEGGFLEEVGWFAGQEG